MEFGILGPLELTCDGRRVEPGGPKQRELLAILLIHLNQVVPAGTLVDALWGTEPPAGAETTLRSHVSHLRSRFAAAGAAGLLVTERPGYALRVDAECVDAFRFERLATQGRDALAAAEPGRAVGLLREALLLWRGPVLADPGYPAFAEPEVARLDQLRLISLEARIDADLSLGRHQELVSELEGLVDAHPFRERFSGQLMLALYRSGRHVDALAVYSSLRQRLADELGLDPGPGIADLQAAILRHDQALSLPVGPAPGARRPRPKPPPDALFAAARQDPMVGRPTELERLRAQWKAVCEGGRRVELVSGEAGVGKTRLVAEFAHHAAGEAAFLVGRCDGESAVAYHAILAALRSNPDTDDIVAGAPDAVRSRLERLLGTPTGPPGQPPGSPNTPSDERLALFDAVVWLLGRLAAEAPVAVVLDEAERIDHASSLLLRHVVDKLPARLLLLVCFRDPPGSKHGPLLELLGDLEGRRLADRVALRPLTVGDLDTLVTRLAGADAPAEFVNRLWRDTGGNPFYATEMVREIAAEGGPTSGARWRVPAAVQDVLRHRLGALPAPSRQAVRCAAVVGREVEFDVLVRLMDEAEDRVIDAVEHAVDGGFLVEAGSSWRVRHAFRHELMREAVYADIPLARRQRLHLRAAHTLLSDEPNRTPDVVAAAAHLRQAGPMADPLQAAELSSRAATETARVYAWDEAIAHAEAAVSILEGAGAPAARRADADVRVAKLRLRASLGYPEAVRHLQSALERYRAIGDDAAAAAVHSRLGGALGSHHSVMDIPRAIEHFAAAERLQGEQTAFRLHSGRAQAAMYGLRTDLLGASSQRAFALATELARVDLTVFAAWARAWFEFNRGRPGVAAKAHDQMWAIARERADPRLGWACVHAAAMCATEYLLDPAAGREWCARGLGQSRFETLDYAHGAVLDQLVLALATAGELTRARTAAESLPADATSRRLLMLLDGQWERAERAWAAALATDEAAGDLHDAAVNARRLAAVRVLLEDTASAVALLRRALALGRDGPQVPTELAARAELARLLAASGELDEAVGHLRGCDEILSAGQDWRGLIGTVELARAAVAAVRGRHADSDAAHERALRVFTGYCLPWRRADALHCWARSLWRLGDDGQARAKLHASRQVYDELGATSRWRRALET